MKKIQYKNLLLTYDIINQELPLKINFLKDLSLLFINILQQKYQNKINFLLLAQQKQKLKVLIALEKKPCFRNLSIFKLPLEKNFKIIRVQNAVSPADIANHIVARSEVSHNYGRLTINREISAKIRKEQSEDAFNYIKKLKAEFEQDPEMTTEEATNLLYQYLNETNNFWFVEKTSIIQQNIKTHFTRIRNLKDYVNIKLLNTFDLVNPQLQFIKNFVLKGLNLIQNDHRSPALIIEGPTGIGKTQFMWSLLNDLKITFNYMKRRLNYSRKRYDDENAEVDIYDDFNPAYLIEKDLLETIFTSQIGHTVETAKHEPDREILKMKVNIFICNPHRSFKDFFYLPANKDLLSYIEPNVVFLTLEPNKQLFLSEKEENKEVLTEENASQSSA
ncbi:MAG: replication protein [Pigeon pea little leaf phytoplasma]|uniref:Replication protein n=1 Tax=Candidatus Phytoplasma fabacearum TaxID=2982628 RepID=A0ABU8ZT36_9MOLU|nr:replication protein [Sweet potato little leaf phytoplasma]MDV3148095.1 replication protein [Candidatus Phytoplasma australasiaticum]MDV3196736.1 replication protein [Pigeon pea little leaf phytoplasma]MDV3148099.1 replication protein [Candidatus Phytoplasma australasiaticum]MDV3152750.1 replication protein [Candidatus Phytoplasma australasiaticum]